MRKLTIFFAALTLSVGLWAQETQMVSYDYPVYINDDATKGIKEWQTGSVEATVVESSDDVVYWGTEGQTSWYVVTDLEGYVQLTKGAVCRGYVHLILAGGTLNASAKYNANGGAGIEVSGSNSLTIYGGGGLTSMPLVDGMVPVSVEMLVPARTLPSMAVRLQHAPELVVPVSVVEVMETAPISSSMAVWLDHLAVVLAPVSVAEMAVPALTSPSTVVRLK